MINSKIIETLPRSNYADGEIIFDLDDKTTDVYFILEGATKSVNFSANGAMAYFKLRKKGDFFGYYSAISGEPRTARMIAVSNTMLAKMDGKEFMRLVTHDPILSEKMLKLIMGILRDETKRLTSLITLNATQQVCVELLMNSMGENHPYTLESRNEMAARLGMTRETLSRILRDLERREAIEVGKNVISIKNPDILQSLAEE